MPAQNKTALNNFRKNYDRAFCPKIVKDRVDLGLSPSTDVVWVDAKDIDKPTDMEAISDEQADER